MRSELVNRLPISIEAKLLLRSMIEHAQIYGTFPKEPKYEMYGDGAYINSELKIRKVACAIQELHSADLIDFDYKTGDCSLLLKNVLKFIKNEAEKGLEDTDYMQVKDLLSQMELSQQA